MRESPSYHRTPLQDGAEIKVNLCACVSGVSVERRGQPDTAKEREEGERQREILHVKGLIGHL